MGTPLKRLTFPEILTSQTFEGAKWDLVGTALTESILPLHHYISGESERTKPLCRMTTGRFEITCLSLGPCNHVPRKQMQYCRVRDYSDEAPQVAFHAASPHCRDVLKLFFLTNASNEHVPYDLSDDVFEQNVSGKGESLRTRRIWGP